MPRKRKTEPKKSERKRGKPSGERKPSGPEEERTLEKEELESFRRRQQWFEETFGDSTQPNTHKDDGDDDVKDD